MAWTSKPGWEHILVIAIVCVGLTARLYQIHYNFDGDELFSVTLASKGFSEVIVGSLQDKPHPPLHNVLLHVWIKVFGTSEVAARALSIAFSGAFLVVSYALFRRIVDRWLALGLLCIVALSPLFVYFGQQARPYSLIAFLSSVNLLAFSRVLEAADDRKRLLLWALSCCLLLYAQYLGAVLIGCELAIGVWYLRSHRLLMCTYGCLGSALIAPWMIAAMGRSVFAGADPLPHISWMVPPSTTDFLWFYVSIFGEGPGVGARWLFLILAILGVAYIKRSVALKSFPANHALYFLIGIGLPAVVYVLSVWGPKPIFAERQLLGAALAIVAAIGLCLATLPSTVAAGIVLTLVAWTAASLPQAFPQYRKPPWGTLAAEIDERYGSTIVVTEENWIKVPLDRYRKSGPVRLWDELTDREKNDRFLFVCRPVVGKKCSTLEGEVPESRRSLALTKRWGSESAEQNVLRLYEITGGSN